jgi:hypothetical protein
VTNQSPSRGITPAPGISLSASSDLRHRAASWYDQYDQYDPPTRARVSGFGEVRTGTAYFWLMHRVR